MNFNNKNVVIAGLDKAGVSAVRYFIKQGANVVVADLRTRLEVQKALDKLKDHKVKFEFGRYGSRTFFSADYIFKSMLLKHDDRILEQAKKRNIKIFTEFEFLASQIKKPILGVLGTNGKTTIAVLLAEMFRHDAKKVFISGHIGGSLYSFVEQQEKYDLLILELDYSLFNFAYAFEYSSLVLTNITDEEIIEKENQWVKFSEHVKHYTDFLYPVSRNVPLLYPRDDENVFTVVSTLKSKNIPFSLNLEEQDLEAYKHGAVYKNSSNIGIKIEGSTEVKEFDISNIKLKGSFNIENMMVAVFLANKYGVSDTAINFVIENFAGIEHRLEFVGKINNVYFYNDARSTTIRGLARTLTSFNKKVVLITGGKDNNEDYEPLIHYARKYVKSMIIMGESKDKMNRIVGDYTETFVVGSFEEAVVLAYQKSQNNDIVLFSPGSLPSGKFKKIEERGKRFKEIISTFTS